MSNLLKAQIACAALALVGFVWLTIDVFDTIEPDSLQAAAILTWCGLAGSAVCALIRYKKKK